MTPCSDRGGDLHFDAAREERAIYGLFPPAWADLVGVDWTVIAPAAAVVPCGR